nr:MAG TPA: hypothetical protein [Caudoviricetes sp.]
MKTTEKNTIQSVQLALERIEVHGSGNLDLLLGCIQALDRLLATAEAEEVSDG